jgi:SAM-dependent methyltransferase
MTVGRNYVFGFAKGGISMAKQDEIMADARAFMKSRVILTAAELDLFTHLHKEPATAADLTAKLKLHRESAQRILDCLTGFGFVSKQGDTYSLTERGAYFSDHHPQSILPMIKHYNHLWENWSALTNIVRNGSNPARASGIDLDETQWRSFIGAMHVVGRELSEQIAEDYDLSGFHRLLDIGGASGTYTVAFLRKQAGLRAVLFDLENVIPTARKRLESEGLLHRVDLVAGDFYKDELPADCDLAFLSAIIHQNSNEENLELYRNIYRALQPGGAILIRDFFMDEDRTKPPPGALFDLNMLVATRGGKTYTFSEIEAALQSAGFQQVRWARHGEGMDSLVEARKPA